MNNIYDVVKDILIVSPNARNSDKYLMWLIWSQQLSKIQAENITYGFWLSKAVTPESITRARRKVQEDYPELKGSKSIEKARKAKEKEKGTFIYREEVNGLNQAEFKF